MAVRHPRPSFGDKQMSALADYISIYIQAALMLKYNDRMLG